MSFRIKYLCYVLFLISNIGSASENLIQVPDFCIKNMTSPCLVRSNHQLNVFEWAGQQIRLSAGSTLQIQKNGNSDVGSFDFILLKGSVALRSDLPYRVFGYRIENSQTQYVKRSVDGQIQILDLSTLDLKTFINEKNQQNDNNDVFVLQKSDFLDRKSLVQYLSEFYKVKSEFKKELNLLAKKYKQRLNDDSLRQSQVLQNHINRKIASDEDAIQQRNIKSAKILENQKRSRELFFMRTFEQ